MRKSRCTKKVIFIPFPLCYIWCKSVEPRQWFSRGNVFYIITVLKTNWECIMAPSFTTVATCEVALCLLYTPVSYGRNVVSIFVCRGNIETMLSFCMHNQPNMIIVITRQPVCCLPMTLLICEWKCLYVYDVDTSPYLMWQVGSYTPQWSHYFWLLYLEIIYEINTHCKIKIMNAYNIIYWNN